MEFYTVAGIRGSAERDAFLLTGTGDEVVFVLFAKNDGRNLFLFGLGCGDGLLGCFRSSLLLGYLLG